jgi:hypothetical protein
MLLFSLAFVYSDTTEFLHGNDNHLVFLILWEGGIRREEEFEGIVHLL